MKYKFNDPLTDECYEIEASSKQEALDKYNDIVWKNTLYESLNY